MRAETIERLKKLAKGKAALTREQLRDFCADIKGSDLESLLEKVYAVAVKRQPTPKPAWLVDIETAKKKRKTWKAADFVDALYEVASSNGWISENERQSRPASVSLPVAAKRLAAKATGEKLSAAFVAYIDKEVAQDKRT